jgi:hypothetical protein
MSSDKNLSRRDFIKTTGAARQGTLGRMRVGDDTAQVPRQPTFA